jgi:N-acetylneuraminic acid mutarotase
LARAEIGAAELDGLVYLVGGQGPGGRSTGAVLAFEPRTKRFSPMPPVPDRVDHPLVTTDGRELFVVGGYRDSEPLNTGWRYSPATRRWSALPSMRVARGGLGGGVIDGRLYAVTGAPRTWPNEYVRPYDVTEVLDLRTGRWSFGPPIPVARHHLGTATVDGAVYIVGGRNPDDFSLRRVDRLDPRTGRWEQAAPLPQGVAAPMVAATEHGLVVAGGSDPERWEGEGGGWVTPAAWAFDARRDRWRRLPDLRVASHQGAAGVVDGRAYVFEGAPCPGFARTHAVETLRLPAD